MAFALGIVALMPDSPHAAAQATRPGTPQWSAPPEMTIDPGSDYSATITTNLGEIEVSLFAAEAPLTVNNFVFLASQDFYRDVPFHRVINNFMIQSGDPTGTGTGGPGYRFADEPVTRPYEKGIVAMANAGPNTNGSQFFIVHGAEVTLPPNYTIFGQVVAGMDVVDALATTPVSASRSGEMSVPQNDLRIDQITITVR